MDKKTGVILTIEELAVYLKISNLRFISLLEKAKFHPRRLAATGVFGKKPSIIGLRKLELTCQLLQGLADDKIVRR